MAMTASAALDALLGDAYMKSPLVYFSMTRMKASPGRGASDALLRTGVN
jgi:hypothetical protein